MDAQINSKQIDTYHVTDEDIDYTDKWAGNPNGWQNEDDVPMNKPNATILGVPDGLLVQNGQPYEFTGYVDGYDEKIASVEFSLDRGETWTKYDIGDMDRNKMVWWSFTYKPELEGAYCHRKRHDELRDPDRHVQREGQDAQPRGHDRAGKRIADPSEGRGGI